MWRVVYRLNMLRWRLARLVAPGRIVAAPIGGDGGYLFIEQDGGRVWVTLDSFKLKSTTHLKRPEAWLPPLGDPYALGTVTPSRTGRLVATFGKTK